MLQIHKPPLPWYAMDDKSIKRMYTKRRKLLQSGHCVRCGYKLTETRMQCEYLPDLIGQLISKGGIMKDKSCPNCKTDLIEFCFQDILDEANSKADKILKTASEKASKMLAKNTELPSKKEVKKKPKKRSSDQYSLF